MYNLKNKYDFKVTKLGSDDDLSAINTKCQFDLSILTEKDKKELAQLLNTRRKKNLYKSDIFYKLLSQKQRQQYRTYLKRSDKIVQVIGLSIGVERSKRVKKANAVLNSPKNMKKRKKYLSNIFLIHYLDYYSFFLEKINYIYIYIKDLNLIKKFNQIKLNLLFMLKPFDFFINKTFFYITKYFFILKSFFKKSEYYLQPTKIYLNKTFLNSSLQTNFNRPSVKSPFYIQKRFGNVYSRVLKKHPSHELISFSGTPCKKNIKYRPN
jgi:hypothetical protein